MDSVIYFKTPHVLG